MLRKVFFTLPVLLLAVAPVCTGLTTTQLSQVIADLNGLIPSAPNFQGRTDMVGGMLRLSFHDAFGEGTQPDGCLDPNESDHNGLTAVRAVVDPICAAHKDELSRADCWALAGNVAIEAAGGNPVPFRYGRVDCPDEAASNDAGMLPSAKPGGNPWHHILSVFHDRAGFSVREIVALMGAHSLGRPSSEPSDNSGFTALPWVRGNGNTNDVGGSFLTTQFYSSITGVPWTKSNSIEGEWLHAPPGRAADTLMLDTDMGLVVDTSSCDANGNGPVRFGGGGGGGGKGGQGGGFVSNPGNAGGCVFNQLPFNEVRRYAEQPESVWRAEFTMAVQKMQEMGYSTWESTPSVGGPIVSTWLLSVTSDVEVTPEVTSTSAPTTSPSMTAQIDMALNYVSQLVGTQYGWWAGGQIPATAPAWAEDAPIPAVEAVRSSSVNCAGVPNLMLRAVGGSIPCLQLPQPDPECGQCCGGTGAYSRQFESVAEPFDIEKSYPRGTLLGRPYRNVQDQGHTAVLLGDGPTSLLLQASGTPGVNTDLTLLQAYESLPFCDFTYAVLPENWLIRTAEVIPEVTLTDPPTDPPTAPPIEVVSVLTDPPTEVINVPTAQPTAPPTLAPSQPLSCGFSPPVKNRWGKGKFQVGKFNRKTLKWCQDKCEANAQCKMIAFRGRSCRMYKSTAKRNSRRWRSYTKECTR